MDILQKFKLDGKVALVTGGAQGIGFCAAQGLASAGAKIVLADINQEKNQQAAKQLAAEGYEAIAIQVDVTQQPSVRALFAAAVEAFGGIDIVFNNAGICNLEAVETVSQESWMQVMNVNLNGVFYVAQCAGQQMIKQGRGGSIVNMASMSGTIVNEPQKQASYNASKAAVVHLTKSMAVEWAPQNIRVNSLSPGYMGTELNFRLEQSLLDYWMSRTPMKRMGDPEELQGAVLYFASAASGFTTGSNLIVDGGFTCI